MSDALDYLMKVRPVAMESYFGFLRQAGTHLDPKTRAIISVLTKVDKQTENGFRQYLSRALETDVSADEILDAMLVAFPSLGLSKIVWAIDILLQMDLPEFDAEKLGRVAAWQVVCKVEDLQNGDVSFFNVSGARIIVYRESDHFSVYDSTCPHQSTIITEAGMNGHTLTCPKHGWQFDITSGQCIAVGNRPLKQLMHRIEAGQLTVKLSC